MRFCPKCGRLMRPRIVDGERILECPNCGYSELVKAHLEGYSVRKRIEHTNKEKIAVIDESKIPKVLPVTRSVECPKCGNREAYYWMMQTRAADEPPTRFYRCTKCGFTWREYE